MGRGDEFSAEAKEFLSEIWRRHDKALEHFNAAVDSDSASSRTQAQQLLRETYFKLGQVFESNGNLKDTAGYYQQIQDFSGPSERLKKLEFFPKTPRQSP